MRLVIASTTAAILATTTTASSTTTASVVASKTPTTTKQQQHSIRGGGVIGSKSGGRKATPTTGTAATATDDVARSVAIDIDTSKTTAVYHHYKNNNQNPVVQKLLNIKRKTKKTSSTDLEDNNNVSLLLDLGAITPKIKKMSRILSAAANNANNSNNANTNNTKNRHAGHHGRSLTNNSFDEEPLVEDRADKVSIHSGANIRNPTNVVTNFMIPSLQYLCEQTESSTQSSFCDCENFDFKLQKGRIDCNLVEENKPYCSSTINSCGEEVEICYYDSIHLEAIGVGDDYFYTTCLTYTQPYQQQICTTFTMSNTPLSSTPSPQMQVTNDDRTKQVIGIEYYDEQQQQQTTTSSSSCDVTFNNKQCNSCETEIREYELGDNIYYNRCFEIDCGNNGNNDNDNTIINTCDNGDSSPNSGVSTLKDKIIFGDDCTKCQPCGIGYYMKNLMGIGIFPIIGEYTCSGLELGSKIGFFDRELCEEIQSQTNIYCDCQPLFTTDASNNNETETELQSPSFAGGIVSSTEPEPEPKKEIEPEIEPEAATETETETTDPPLFVLPGDTMNGSMCHVCGSTNNSAADDSTSNSNSKVVVNVNNPNMILNLPNSSVSTTCLSLEAAGRLGFFSSDYCTDIVQPLVFTICGGCTTTSTGTSNIVTKDDDNNVSLRSSSLSAESTSTTPAVVAAINTTTTLMIAEEESKMSADDNVPPPTTATTTTIQDNHPISCFVCDPDSELRLQNETVRLDEGESEDEDATSLSCSEFETALIQVNSHGRTRMNLKTGKIFVTEEFCLEKAHLLAKTYCGGCILKAEKGTTPTTTATTTILSSDNNNNNKNIVQSLVNDALKVAGDEDKETETEENNNNNDYKYHDDYDDDNVIMIGRGGVGIENEIIENENNDDNGNSKKLKPLPRFYRDVPPEEINVGEDATPTNNNDTTSQSITTDPSSASSAASSSSLLVTMWSAASMMAVLVVSYHYVS